MGLSTDKTPVPENLEKSQHHIPPALPGSLAEIVRSRRTVPGRKTLSLRWMRETISAADPARERGAGTLSGKCESVEIIHGTWGETFRYGAVIATDNDYDVIRRELDGNSMPAKGNY